MSCEFTPLKEMNPEMLRVALGHHIEMAKTIFVTNNNGTLESAMNKHFQRAEVLRVELQKRSNVRSL